jgi:hypothetical protein
MSEAVGDQEERHAAALQRLIRFEEDRTFRWPGPAPAAGIADTSPGEGAGQMASAAAAVNSARGQSVISAIFGR